MLIDVALLNVAWALFPVAKWNLLLCLCARNENLVNALEDALWAAMTEKSDANGCLKDGDAYGPPVRRESIFTGLQNFRGFVARRARYFFFFTFVLTLSTIAAPKSASTTVNGWRLTKQLFGFMSRCNTS